MIFLGKNVFEPNIFKSYNIALFVFISMSTNDAQHYNDILTNELWTENDEHNIPYTFISHVLQFILLKLKKKKKQ